MAEYGSPFRTAIRSNRWAGPLIQALLALGSLIFMFPMLWMLSTSLKGPTEVMSIPPKLLGEKLAWGNYAETLHVVPFLKYAWNTVIVCVLGVIGTTLSSALVAYSFARMKWPGRDVLFGVVLATMMVPFPVVMVPLYGVFKDLGWIGTLTPLWAP